MASALALVEASTMVSETEALAVPEMVAATVATVAMEAAVNATVDMAEAVVY